MPALSLQLVEVDGRPAVLKVAEPGPAADRLAREAELLAAARHPGVVEVLRAERVAGGGFELALAYAGARTATDLRPRIAQAAAVAAALAATVADLHAVGVRHGRIRPDHVVLDGTGRPVLCGFAGAGRAGEPGAPTPADDVAGVGEVLRSLVGADTEVEPIPERRLSRRPWAGATARALLTLADQATAEDPARRPSAAALAASIASLVPTAEPRPARRASRAGVAAAVGVVAVMAVAAVVWLGVGGDGGGEPVAAGVVAAGEPIRRLEPVATVDGRVVERDGTRYAVGEPGDVLAVGDWDCDGEATVVAVRPSTGEVFHFARWPTPGREVTVAAAAVVPGGQRPEPAGRCGRVAVVADGGERTEVELR